MIGVQENNKRGDLAFCEVPSCKLNEKERPSMVGLISFSSFAPPEALLFVTKPKPVETGTLSHFKTLLASFIPEQRVVLLLIRFA
jgi:hypothetical protein